MELTGLGGGIMLAIAALLWLVYLLPNWLKNREYLATEKNAVRLQQTIRVLAETADVPRIVRADAAARRAAAGPVAVGRAPRVSPPVAHAPQPGLVAMRQRRTRAVTSLVLLVSVIVALVQLVLMVAVGVVLGSWLVLAASALGAMGSISLLRRLANVSRARTAPVAQTQRRTSLGHEAIAVPQRGQEWTPVALPKPLYLSRATAAPSVELSANAEFDVNADLERAAADAERALREQKQPPAITPAVVRQPAASRFASMGIVDVPASGAPDLDAVLARRRAAG
jgi:hypothetical protein